MVKSSAPMFETKSLLGVYNLKMGKNLEEHRKSTQHKRIQGNRAVILAKKRKTKRLENQKNSWSLILNSANNLFQKTNNHLTAFKTLPFLFFRLFGKNCITIRLHNLSN